MFPDLYRKRWKLPAFLDKMLEPNKYGNFSHPSSLLETKFELYASVNCVLA